MKTKPLQTEGESLTPSTARRRPASGLERSRPRATPPARSWEQLFDGPRWIALRIAADVVMLAAGCAAALALAGPRDEAWVLLIFPGLTLLLLDASGRYRQRMRDVVLDRAAPGLGAISMSAMVTLALHLVVRDEALAIEQLIAWSWLFSLSGVTAVTALLTGVQRGLRRRRRVQRPTLIAGVDSAGLDMAARLQRLPEYGLSAVGFLDEIGPDLPLPMGAPPLLGGLDDLSDVALMHDVKHVIICFPRAPYGATRELIARCDELGLQTTVVPRLSAAVNHQTRFEYLGTQPMLNLRAVDRECWRFGLKHLLDRAVAALALLALAPLLAIIALAVRLSSPGPILFRQMRAGRDGQLFELLKFRTMLEPAGDDAGTYACGPGMAPGGVEGLDRRTPVGRLLRRTSLDELAQLLNVVRGEMSIVGPRPERPEFAELFREEVEHYHERQRVRSGITGWAQVHGARGQTPLADRVELDNFYIDHWSLALDVKIMLLTLPALLRGS